jgi:hypothetical protein
MGNWEPGLWLALRAQAGCSTLQGPSQAQKGEGDRGLGQKAKSPEVRQTPGQTSLESGSTAQLLAVWSLMSHESGCLDFLSRRPYPFCLPERSFGGRQTNKQEENQEHEVSLWRIF